MDDLYYSGNPDLSYEDRAKYPLYRHVAKTYGWMFLGLLLTFTTASLLYMGLASGMTILYSLYGKVGSIVTLVAQLGLVVYFSARFTKYSVATAKAIFIAYSILTGVTFSILFLVYQLTSIVLAFGVAALFFGVMAAAGLITKRDVSGLRPIVLIGLVALIVMELISLLFHLDGFDTMICFLGIAIFMGITTYDAKRTKDLYYAFQTQDVMLEKVAIYSALELYLDFINLFLYLLRLFGKRK